MDKKETVLEALTALRQKAIAESEPFKVRAYNKAIQEIKALPHIKTKEDVSGVPGLGAKIQAKIAEILETGTLAEAAEASEAYSLDSYNALQKVYGIGPVKAKDFVGKGILTLDNLRAAAEQNPKLLTAAQKVGLQYVDDLSERIPRKEMDKHVEYLRSVLPAAFKMEVVGSYRRGASSSGDIDVMITVKDAGTSRATVEKDFAAFVGALEEDGYIKAAFARGKHKFMGICRLARHKTHRHIDILLCDPEEYWYTILYFTGSDLFNVSMRRHALSRGYSLSEHGLKAVGSGLSSENLRLMTASGGPMRPEPGSGSGTVPRMESEKAIFEFLGLDYVPPEERNLPLS